MKLCFLHSYNRLKDALKALNISNSLSKKYKLPLQKKVLAKQEWDLPMDLLGGRIGPFYKGPEIKVISEGEILVLDKPSFVHCESLRYQDQSIEVFLRHHYPKYFLLHRLDFETSGILLCVRNPNISGLKKKVYQCICHGQWLEKKSINHRLAPWGLKGAKMVFNEIGVDANITVTPLKICGNFSLVEVELKEGHRHQIRCQMSLCGHPIVGDKLYGAQAFKRILLHSFEYEYSGKKYQSSLPNDFWQFLESEHGI